MSDICSKIFLKNPLSLDQLEFAYNKSGGGAEQQCSKSQWLLCGTGRGDGEVNFWTSASLCLGLMVRLRLKRPLLRSKDEVKTGHVRIPM